jgi:integrase
VSNCRNCRFIEAEGRQNRYVPTTPELAAELQHYPAVIGEERMFPPNRGTKSERLRVEETLEIVLERWRAFKTSVFTTCGIHLLCS